MGRRLKSVEIGRLRAAIASSPIVVLHLVACANARISALIADWQGSSVALQNVEPADIEVLDWIVSHARRPQPEAPRALM